MVMRSHCRILVGAVILRYVVGSCALFDSLLYGFFSSLVLMSGIEFRLGLWLVSICFYLGFVQDVSWHLQLLSLHYTMLMEGAWRKQSVLQLLPVVPTDHLRGDGL